MKLFIDFLLISSLSIIIIECGYFKHLRRSEIECRIKGVQSCLTGLPNYIKLLEGEKIFKNKNTIVWKGKYKDTIDVAIKIANDQSHFDDEMAAYEKLNATKDDFDTETYRIPKVYHHGDIFYCYHAIVMTLCGETLEKRFELQNRNFSDSTLLLIFKQLVETLKYIHSNNVVHLDINLSNILICGENVFLGDFDMAKIEEGYRLYDYNSLLQMIWYMARMPPGRYIKPNAVPLEYFGDEDVREAFQFILNIRDINGEYGIQPNYEEIIKIADKALTQIVRKSGKLVRFDWLEKGQLADLLALEK